MTEKLNHSCLPAVNNNILAGNIIGSPRDEKYDQAFEIIASTVSTKRNSWNEFIGHGF